MLNLTMRGVLLLVVLLAILATLNGCKSAPKIEHCILGEGLLLCYDDRLPKGQKEYDLTFEQGINYICTNADDFQTLKEWAIKKKR